jgi:hypothetical protein
MRVATAMPQRRLLIHLSRSDSATKRRGSEDEERMKEERERERERERECDANASSK